MSLTVATLTLAILGSELRSITAQYYLLASWARQRRSQIAALPHPAHQLADFSDVRRGLCAYFISAPHEFSVFATLEPNPVLCVAIGRDNDFRERCRVLV
jgi:hypothetical protein